MHWAFFAPELSATSTMLLGWIIALVAPALRGARPEYLADLPPLVLRQWARLLDQNAVPDLAGIGFVMGLDSLRPRDHALVARMSIHALDDDHAGLRHLVAHDQGFAGLSHVLPVRRCTRPGRPLRRPTDIQLALAEHGLRAREIALGLPDARGVLGNTHRELKPKIEQLLGQVRRLLRELVARHVVPLD